MFFIIGSCYDSWISAHITMCLCNAPIAQLFLSQESCCAHQNVESKNVWATCFLCVLNENSLKRSMGPDSKISAIAKYSKRVWNSELMRPTLFIHNIPPNCLQYPATVYLKKNNKWLGQAHLLFRLINNTLVLKKQTKSEKQKVTRVGWGESFLMWKQNTYSRCVRLGESEYKTDGEYRPVGCKFSDAMRARYL